MSVQIPQLTCSKKEFHSSFLVFWHAIQSIAVKTCERVDCTVVISFYSLSYPLGQFDVRCVVWSSAKWNKSFFSVCFESFIQASTAQQFSTAWLILCLVSYVRQPHEMGQSLRGGGDLNRAIGSVADVLG